MAGFGNSDKLKTVPPKGSAIFGSAVEYAPYQEFGTRRMDANPFITPAAAIIKAKANGVYKDELGKKIVVAAAKKYKQMISEGVEFRGTNIDLALDQGVEVAIQILASAAVTQAKNLGPSPDTGRLRASIMWRSSKKQGGFGA